MSYESIVYRILIASPSDVDEEREIVARIIQDWNDLNSFNKKIVLLPVRWETHSSPTFGVRPQEAINKQLVDDCDMLIGFFWTKIGTPTGVEIGGTVEEIKRVSKAGKPVMLYFSKRAKDPSLLDISQLESLNKFKEEIYSSALVENFNSTVDFRDKLSRQLEMKIRELQERKAESKDLVTFSFIDKSSGNFFNNELDIELERIEIEEKKRLEILKTNPKVIKRKWDFNRALMTYLNKKNNIPIILGLQNNVSRVLGNVNIELKLKSSKENLLNVESFNNHEDVNIGYRLDEFVNKEEESKILKLFNNEHVQTSSDSWEFRVKPFTLLPNKMKIIESLILLFPKDSMKITFSLKMFSDNILQAIENSCEINVKYKSRFITEEEIYEIIDKLPEEDDFPF